MGLFGVGNKVAEGGDDEMSVEGCEAGVGCSEVGYEQGGGEEGGGDEALESCDDAGGGRWGGGGGREAGEACWGAGEGWSREGAEGERGARDAH